MSIKLYICTNFRANPNQPSCAARASQLLLESLKQQLAKKNIAVAVEASPCMGYCHIGPNARLAPNGDFFHGISADNLAQIVQAAEKFSAD